MCVGACVCVCLDGLQYLKHLAESYICSLLWGEEWQEQDMNTA